MNEDIDRHNHGKIGINFLSLMDGKLAMALREKDLSNYNQRTEFIQDIEKEIEKNDWVEFYNGVTFEKTFEPGGKTISESTEVKYAHKYNLKIKWSKRADLDINILAINSDWVATWIPQEEKDDDYILEVNIKLVERNVEIAKGYGAKGLNESIEGSKKFSTVEKTKRGMTYLVAYPDDLGIETRDGLETWRYKDSANRELYFKKDKKEATEALKGF